jgi:glycosyltransferase involved in cell wall biosynthesis
MGRPLRVVIVAPLVPFDAPPHAGGRYLQQVVRYAEECIGPTTVIVPSTPDTRATADGTGAPAHLLVVGGESARSVAGKAVNRAVAIADRQLRRVDPGLPHLALGRGLVRAGPARTALEEADVVDLQWSESIRFARLVRRINGAARVVGTYHDVQSQLFGREPAHTAGARAYWRFASWQSRWHERLGVAALDEVAVFSNKDARLLADPPHVRVIHPPLATGDERFPDPPPMPPTVLFVAYFARAENEDAATWLLREVWPTVRATVPDVRLRLVGRGLPDGLLALVDDLPNIEAPGFVDDLDPEYAAASLVVVPLRQGAGVKFKTVEALLHGVPVVTTPVGAEGIDGPDLYAGLADDPARFAAACVAALAEPGPARGRSRTAQSWAVREYSLAAFEQNVRHHYGID